jgi:hypothetical protein
LPAQPFDADLSHAYSLKWLTMTKPNVPIRITRKDQP